MNDNRQPDPNTVHPIAGYDREIYVKPTIRNPNIRVGDFTYIADSEFERHVTHHYDWIGDRLIIGKFCQIAAGVEFVMNGANHQMNAVSTFPFYTLAGWHMQPPQTADLPLKGDTVIGNDVWIGQNAVILPGVQIGDGAIIGANSVVGGNIAAYTVAAGNPAQPIRKRFDDAMIDLLLQFRWWDRDVGEIDRLIPLLTSSDIPVVKAAIRAYLAADTAPFLAAQCRRITAYETLLNEAAQCLCANTLDRSKLREYARRLEAYYTSDAWKQDFVADEAGLLPSGLRRGVLSEDGISNLLDACRDCAAIDSDPHC